MVVVSLEDGEGTRCVDIIRRPDGMFSFKAFRRDPEDEGRWSVTADYSSAAYATQDDALRAAAATIPWLAEVADKNGPAREDTARRNGNV